MNDDYRDVAEAFERIAPHGPPPDGWAAKALRRSRGRRAAVGVAAVAAVALLVAPLATSLMEFNSRTVTANPADPATEEQWEPPGECMTAALAPDEPGGALPEEVVAGAYCWNENQGTMRTARGLDAEELDIVIAALGISESLGFSPMATYGHSAPWVGQLWLEDSTGSGLLVLVDADGGLMWRAANGELLYYPSTPGLTADDPQVRAALDGILRLSHALQIPGRSFCWAELEASDGGLQDAVAGHLCDPTGTTLAEIERSLPKDVVALVATAAVEELAPAGRPAPPTGWGLTLVDADGDAIWLHLLADGTFAYQAPDGGEWGWAPDAEVVEALRVLGMEHLR